ncbi:MAG: hypothetical protein QXE80_03505 [Pyrobaculum sp.]
MQHAFITGMMNGFIDKYNDVKDWALEKRGERIFRTGMLDGFLTSYMKKLAYPYFPYDPEFEERYERKRRLSSLGRLLGLAGSGLMLANAWYKQKHGKPFTINFGRNQDKPVTLGQMGAIASSLGITLNTLGGNWSGALWTGIGSGLAGSPLGEKLTRWLDAAISQAKTSKQQAQATTQVPASAQASPTVQTQAATQTQPVQQAQVAQQPKAIKMKSVSTSRLSEINKKLEEIKQTLSKVRTSQAPQTATAATVASAPFVGYPGTNIYIISPGSGQDVISGIRSLLLNQPSGKPAQQQVTKARTQKRTSAAPTATNKPSSAGTQIAAAPASSSVAPAGQTKSQTTPSSPSTTTTAKSQVANTQQTTSNTASQSVQIQYGTTNLGQLLQKAMQKKASRLDDESKRKVKEYIIKSAASQLTPIQRLRALEYLQAKRQAKDEEAKRKTKAYELRRLQNLAEAAGLLSGSAALGLAAGSIGIPIFSIPLAISSGIMGIGGALHLTKSVTQDPWKERYKLASYAAVEMLASASALRAKNQMRKHAQDYYPEYAAVYGPEMLDERAAVRKREKRARRRNALIGALASTATMQAIGKMTKRPWLSLAGALGSLGTSAAALVSGHPGVAFVGLTALPIIKGMNALLTSENRPASGLQEAKEAITDVGKSVAKGAVNTAKATVTTGKWIGKAGKFFWDVTKKLFGNLKGLTTKTTNNAGLNNPSTLATSSTQTTASTTQQTNI